MVRKTKELDALDKHIGQRLKDFRIQNGMSAQQLADKLEVTHQQQQKYEKALNRISASRLMVAARALGRKIDDFYPSVDNPLVDSDTSRLMMDICRDMEKIPSKTTRLAIRNVIKEFVKN